MAIRKIPKDTDTFIFHNENPKNNRTGDCVLRSIATATGKTWDEVLDDLVTVAHKTKLMPNDPKCYGKYIESLGFEKQKQPRKADNTKYTGDEFCEYLKERFVNGDKAVDVVAHIGGGHTVAVIYNHYDKVYRVIDTWDSTDGTIGNYWIKWQ